VSGHTATIGLSWVTLGESAGKYNLLNGSWWHPQSQCDVL
jgi:hypothetical protein